MNFKKIVLYVPLMLTLCPLLHASMPGEVDSKSAHERNNSFPDIINHSSSVTPKKNSGSQSPIEQHIQPAQQLEGTGITSANLVDISAMINERTATNAANRKKLFSSSRTVSSVAPQSKAKSPGLRVRHGSASIPALPTAFTAAITIGAAAHKDAREKRRVQRQLSLTTTQPPTAQPEATAAPSSNKILNRMLSQVSPASAAETGITPAQRRTTKPSHIDVAIGLQPSAAQPAYATATADKPVPVLNQTIVIHNNPAAPAPAACCVIL